MKSSVQSMVSRGFPLYEVATEQGTTLELGCNKAEIKDAIRKTDSCVAYHYSGEQKTVFCRKSGGDITFGSPNNI